MNRLGNHIFSSALAVVVAASLAACGGASRALPSAVGAAGTSTPSDKLVNATFTITIPAPATSGTAKTRRPAYISAATKSVRVDMTTSTAFASPGAQFNVITNVTNGTGNAPGSPCTGGPVYTCTIVIQVPPGSDTFTFTTYDAAGGTGNVLSQQQQILAVTAGTANSFNVTFDANAATMVVSGTGACTTGPVGASFGSVGTSPANFTVAYTDPAGKTVIAPGLPKLSVTATSVSGGTITVSVNQSSQTYSLTPSTSSVTGTINVQATPANTTGSSDGLSFTQTKSYTFSTGPAPPGSFLAVVEQLGTNSGKIDLYTVSFGAPDSFTPYTVTGGGNSLAVTNSTNENKPDVDNPRDLLFDGNGDLLLANGGQGGALVNGIADYGDFACVPAGAIATGSTTTTTTSANAHDSESLALGTDGSVALGNVPSASTYDLIEDVFGTTYTAAPTSRDIANPGGLGDTAIVALPTSAANPAGTYATALTNGTTVSKVAIKRPDGTETDITDSTIVDPDALGFDAANNQLVIANFNTSTSYLDFYSVGTTPAKVKALLIRDDGFGDSEVEGAKVAVSSSGYVAVGGISQSGNPEVMVYDNTAARNPVGPGPIPFDSTTTNNGSTYVYGQTVVVEGLRFLTATKLLVALYSSTSTKQGIYTYDVTQTQTNSGFDGSNGGAALNSVKQTGFLNFATNPPLGAAYKP